MKPAVVTSVRRFVVATAVGILVSASPSLATPSLATPSLAHDGAYPISRQRAVALVTCNRMAAAVHPHYEDGHNRNAYYRACMAAHDQAE
jgi:hypothetical protein